MAVAKFMRDCELRAIGAAAGALAERAVLVTAPIGVVSATAVDPGLAETGGNAAGFCAIGAGALAATVTGGGTVLLGTLAIVGVASPDEK